MKLIGRMMAMVFCILTVIFQLGISEAEEVKIWLATDLHYLTQRLNDGGASFQKTINNADGKVTMYAEEIVETLVAETIAEHPDALILSGDLTFNGAIISHTDLIRKLKRVREAGIPVLVVPGNHDTNYPFAARFTGNTYELVTSPKAEEFATFYKLYGPTGAMSNAPDSFSYVYPLREKLWVLMLDTAAAKDSALTEQTLAWAIEMLEQAEKEGAKVIAVSHHNLMVHSPMFISGFRFYGADELLEAYQRTGVVLCHFSGHMHLQHIVREPFPEVVNSSLSVWPCQMGVITITDNKLTYQVRQPDVSAWARANGSDNEELLNFDQFAMKFFKDLSARKFKIGSTDEEEADLKAETMAELNLVYFSGRPANLEAMAEGIELWMDEDGNFGNMYLKSILDDRATGDDHLFMELTWD